MTWHGHIKQGSKYLMHNQISVDYFSFVYIWQRTLWKFCYTVGRVSLQVLIVTID